MATNSWRGVPRTLRPVVVKSNADDASEQLIEREWINH
jgi:hypothetical protein